LQALAVLGPTEDPALPGVQTVAQMGFGDIDGTTYIGVLAPAGTPKDIQDKLAAAIQQAVKDPQMIASARELGSVAYPGTPQEFAKVLDAEYTLSSKAAKEGRLKAE
jgi:tripartite-type tricarboxylate transporter receptor subunit TctC